jgi:hypothetical protein
MWHRSDGMGWNRRTDGRVRRWRGNPRILRGEFAVFVVFALYLTSVVGASITLVEGQSVFGVDLEARCAATSFSCGIVAGALGLFLPLTLASFLFLLRVPRMAEPYSRNARAHPAELVPWVGRTHGQVIGREDLCRVMIAELRDAESRRPQVVVGGAGTGKTALLIRLAQLLAECGAIPVPVRLRDAQDSLNFAELARSRFIASAQPALRSGDEGERVWRRLRQKDQIVVLADGLEEALIEGGAATSRDYAIHLALLQANEERLPLILTSRPQRMLPEMEAAIATLEPLSEGAAREYARGMDSSQDEQRLDSLVQMAEVAESPLYLEVTRRLHQAGLLESVCAQWGDRASDGHSWDRSSLRLGLLRTWEDALVRGRFLTEVPLSAKDRLATIEQLSLLACVGLKQDRRVVKLADLETLRWINLDSPILGEVSRRLRMLGRSCDIRLAVVRGTRLGLGLPGTLRDRLLRGFLRGEAGGSAGDRRRR